MPGVLLDSHTLYWLVTSPEELLDEALVVIGRNQRARTLCVSPITAWELTIASQKPAHKDPPNLGPNDPSRWFSAAVKATEAKLIPIRQRISCEAAAVVVATGHKDPGDCYLIATARVQKIPIMTRDSVIQRMADPSYLDVIDC